MFLFIQMKIVKSIFFLNAETAKGKQAKELIHMVMLYETSDIEM